MTDPGGGFYSAEDADSVPPEEADNPDAPRMEGAFYVWRDAEIDELLGEDADLARRRFGIEAAGNAPHDPHGEFAGKNLLYVVEDGQEIAARTNRPREAIEAALGRIRQVLFEARQRRPRPHRDDKILTGWNGLTIAAFARAARVLPDSPAAGVYLTAARRAARFVRASLWHAGRGVLLRRYRKGEAGIEGYAEDYAYLVFGLLELFQADGDPAWLDWAEALQAAQDARFWDPAGGGWFATTGEDPTVLLRLKDDHDGAEPAAGSVSVLNLLTLAHLVPEHDGLRKAERALARVTSRIETAARALPMMLCALSAWHHGVGQIVLVGEADSDATRAMRRRVAAHYLPFAVIVPVEPGAHQAALAARLPFAGAMGPGPGASVYVCRDFTCRQPVDRPEALDALLAGAG
jgi:uncharacterized protein